MIYAVVDTDNRVVNMIVADDPTDFDPGDGCVLVKDSRSKAKVGDTYNANTKQFTSA